MGFTYRQYLRMEQGKSLPECGKLYKLFLALRLIPESAFAHELAIAWLRTLAGEGTYRDVFSFIPAAHSAQLLSPMHNAAKAGLATRKYYRTLEQFKAALTDQDTYLCSLAMATDTGVWSVDQIAKALELTRPAAEKALKTLAAAKILKEVKKGFYKCPSANMMVESPHLATLDPTLRNKLYKYLRNLTGHGRMEWRRGGIIRADAEAFKNFMSIMELNLSLAQTYNIPKRTKNSALFHVEGKVTRLRNF